MYDRFPESAKKPADNIAEDEGRHKIYRIMAAIGFKGRRYSGERPEDEPGNREQRVAEHCQRVWPMLEKIEKIKAAWRRKRHDKSTGGLAAPGRPAKQSA